MTTAADHFLIYEPRLVGFHPFALQLITEDLLAGGYRVTLAVNGGQQFTKRREEAIGHLAGRIRMILLPARIRKGRQEAAWLAASLAQSGADRAFLISFDEVASHTLRRAAIGLLPPPHVRGRLGGVYLRPRFLEPTSGWSLNNFLKRRGFKRLLRSGWFDRLFLQDEFLVGPANAQLGAEVFHFLPDPWVGDFSHDVAQARRSLGVPEQARVFLFYGTASPRKGLRVAVQAFQQLRKAPSAFLLCVGDVAQDPAVAAPLQGLEQAGRAKVIGRFISQQEQDLVYCAADVVLMPYLGHYGSSGVLCHAAAAGKMVIASAGDLIRQRVERHGLGWMFESGDAAALQRTMLSAARLAPAEVTRFREAGLAYARTCSREAFRNVLRESLGRPRHAKGP